MGTIQKSSIQLTFGFILAFTISVLLNVGLSTPSAAAGSKYTRVNNQTVKQESIPDAPGPFTTGASLVAPTYFTADDLVSGDAKFWSIKAEANNATYCEQYLDMSVNGPASQRWIEKSTRRGADGKCADKTDSTPVSVNDSGAHIYFYKDANGNGTILPALKGSSAFEFKKIDPLKPNNLGLRTSPVENIYIQTSPTAGIVCPRLLLQYSLTGWGFIGPLDQANVQQSPQTNPESLYYQKILDNNPATKGTGRTCNANNDNAVIESSENSLAQLIGGDAGYWGISSGAKIATTSFHALKNSVKDLGNAVAANDSAAEIRLGTTPVGSIANPILSTKGAEGKTTAPASKCTIDGIGWIICPVVNFMASTADGAFKFLADNFLMTNPKIFDNSTGTFKAWSVMRNIANVAFVIAFLVIIFSQLTSVGITNYGVKKLLPRIIVAALLVNLSYFVCQIAVDISNILGFSIKSVLEGIGATATVAVPDGSVSHFASPSGLTGTAGSILAFGGAAIILYTMLATLVPVVLAALVALVMILFILVARQALIIILIVISPLAFVAYLLPNTEQWYKKWQKAFVALLMLFPIIALVFGMSSLAAAILASASSLSGGFSGPGEPNKLFGQVIAAAVTVLPLFIVPGLLKKALDGVGGIGAKINGYSDKLGGALGKKGSEGYSRSALGRGRELKKQGKQEYRNRQFNDAMAGGGGASQRIRRALGQGGRPLTDSAKFARNRATEAAAGASAAAANKDYNEAVAAATAEQRTMTVGEVATMAATGVDKHGQGLTDQQRAAAIDRTMTSGGFNQRRDVLVGLASDKAHTSRELRARAVSGSYAKGDQNIFGVTFGDQILAERQVNAAGVVTAGGINGAADLAAATVQNAADGHVQAEHLVQGSSATEYLVKSTLDSTDPDAAYAHNNLVNAAATMRATPALLGKSDEVIDASLATL